MKARTSFRSESVGSPKRRKTNLSPGTQDLGPRSPRPEPYSKRPGRTKDKSGRKRGGVRVPGDYHTNTTHTYTQTHTVTV